MIGRWINFDCEGPDITGVTVRADGDRLAVSIDQAGRDGVRHWPAVPGIAMAERTSGGPAIGFLAMGDLFAESRPPDLPRGGSVRFRGCDGITDA